MQKVQKSYTQEFKREAVRLAQTGGKSIAQVARELNASTTNVRNRTCETSLKPDARPQ